MTNVDSDCPDEAKLQGYVAGTSSESEAAAVEAHYFECDRCFEQIELGLDVRATVAETDGPRLAQAPPSGRSQIAGWQPLLAAAAFLLVALGVVWLLGSGDDDRPSVVRGGDVEAPWAVQVGRSDSEIQLDFGPVAGARSYLARLIAADGRVLLEIEVDESPARFDLRESELPEPHDLRGARAEVEALDDLRQTLRASQPIRVEPGEGTE